MIEDHHSEFIEIETLIQKNKKNLNDSFMQMKKLQRLLGHTKTLELALANHADADENQAIQ